MHFQFTVQEFVTKEVQVICHEKAKFSPSNIKPDYFTEAVGLRD